MFSKAEGVQPKWVRHSLLLLVILLTMGRTDAGVIPGRWEKVDALPPGARVAVILKAGDERIEGSFEKSDGASLTLTDGTGAQRRVAKLNVKKVLDPYMADTKWDGMLIGGAVGAGTGALIGPTFWGGPDPPRTKAAAAAIYAIIGAFTGGFVGLVVDETRDRKIVLYTAHEAATDQVSPHLGLLYQTRRTCALE